MNYCLAKKHRNREEDKERREERKDKRRDDVPPTDNVASDTDCNSIGEGELRIFNE